MNRDDKVYKRRESRQQPVPMENLNFVQEQTIFLSLYLRRRLTFCLLIFSADGTQFRTWGMRENLYFFGGLVLLLLSINTLWFNEKIARSLLILHTNYTSHSNQGRVFPTAVWPISASWPCDSSPCTLSDRDRCRCNGITLAIGHTGGHKPHHTRLVHHLLAALMLPRSFSALMPSWEL